MSDDLVKRLREGDEFERFMLAERAADRLEALEAELAKVKEAFRINMMDALPDYTDEMYDKDYAKITGEQK